MPTYQFKELPCEIGNFLTYAASKTAKTPEIILKKFRSEIVKRQSSDELSERERVDVGRDWIMQEIVLETPWNHFKQLRVFTYNPAVEYKSMPVFASVVALKQVDGKIVLRCYDGSLATTLYGMLSGLTLHRRLGVLNQKEISKDKWNNLSIYTNDTCQFYKKQNLATAFTLFDWVKSKVHTCPLLMVDLGSGKGAIGQDFMMKARLAVNHDITSTIDEVHWINVDLSMDNIRASNSIADDENTTGIVGNGKSFIQNPDPYFAKSNLDQTLLKNSNIYIVASGFMTEGVISFSDAVEIMRALKQNVNFKGLIHTGLHASHISPYLAKQVGMTRVNQNIHSYAEDIIEIYEPMDFQQHIARLKMKMRKHGVLDLSYVVDIEKILKAFESEDLSQLETILLAGVSVNQTHVEVFDRLLNQYPNIKIWCASINESEKKSLENMFKSSCAPNRFILLGYVTSTPLFSPTFFHKVSGDEPVQNSSILLQFMRGMSVDLHNPESISMKKRNEMLSSIFTPKRDASDDKQPLSKNKM